MGRVTAFFCALWLASIGLAQPNKPAHKRGTEPEMHGQSCLFDVERGEVPDCVYSRMNTRFITPQYLKDLPFDSYGLAPVHVRDGWMYVNRTGRAVITGVPTFDNGPDDFHDGLVRFVKNNKYGFADRRGKVVVAPIYDGAMNFENGRAEVCKGCVDKCVAPYCEYHVFSGGVWSTINSRGQVVK